MTNISTKQSTPTAPRSGEPVGSERRPSSVHDLNALKAQARLLLTNGTPLADLQALLEEHADDVSDVPTALAAALTEAAFKANPEATVKAKQAVAHDDGYRVVLTPYSQIEAKRTEWVWVKRMPRAALTLLVGTEGLGKTAAGLRFAADFTRGKVPGALEGTPVNVALITPEDDPSRTIKTRALAAGADQSRLFDLKMRKDKSDRGLSLPEDTDRIIDALVGGEVRFAFADPLASMLNPGVNTWKDTDIRDALEPLVQGLAAHDITLLGSLHTNKGNSTDPRQRGMGSAGWRQVPRASFLVGLDPEDEGSKEGVTRCIAHDKHNLGRWTPTVRFNLDTSTIVVEGEKQETVCAVLGEECKVTAAQMLAAESGIERDKLKGKVGAAAAMIERLTADGPVAHARVHAAAMDEGLSWRTVERAADEIGVEKKQVEGGWTWELGTRL